MSAPSNIGSSMSPPRADPTDLAGPSSMDASAQPLAQDPRPHYHDPAAVPPSSVLPPMAVPPHAAAAASAQQVYLLHPGAGYFPPQMAPGGDTHTGHAADVQHAQHAQYPYMAHPMLHGAYPAPASMALPSFYQGLPQPPAHAAHYLPGFPASGAAALPPVPSLPSATPPIDAPAPDTATTGTAGTAGTAATAGAASVSNASESSAALAAAALPVFPALHVHQAQALHAQAQQQHSHPSVGPAAPTASGSYVHAFAPLVPHPPPPSSAPTTLDASLSLVSNPASHVHQHSFQTPHSSAHLQVHGHTPSLHSFPLALPSPTGMPALYASTSSMSVPGAPGYGLNEAARTAVGGGVPGGATGFNYVQPAAVSVPSRPSASSSASGPGGPVQPTVFFCSVSCRKLRRQMSMQTRQVALLKTFLEAAEGGGVQDDHVAAVVVALLPPSPPPSPDSDCIDPESVPAVPESAQQPPLPPSPIAEPAPPSTSTPGQQCDTAAATGAVPKRGMNIAAALQGPQRPSLVATLGKPFSGPIIDEAMLAPGFDFAAFASGPAVVEISAPVVDGAAPPEQIKMGAATTAPFAPAPPLSVDSALPSAVAPELAEPSKSADHALSSGSVLEDLTLSKRSDYARGDGEGLVSLSMTNFDGSSTGRNMSHPTATPHAGTGWTSGTSGHAAVSRDSESTTPVAASASAPVPALATPSAVNGDSGRAAHVAEAPNVDPAQGGPDVVDPQAGPTREELHREALFRDATPLDVLRSYITSVAAALEAAEAGLPAHSWACEIKASAPFPKLMTCVYCDAPVHVRCGICAVLGRAAPQWEGHLLGRKHQAKLHSASLTPQLQLHLPPPGGTFRAFGSVGPAETQQATTAEDLDGKREAFRLVLEAQGAKGDSKELSV